MAPRRSSAKADNLFWSNHVAAWYRSALEAERYCRKHDLSTASLMRWARHLLSAEDPRKHAEHLRNLPRKMPKGQDKKAQSKRRTRPPRYRYGARTDTGPIALRAFWGMHVEAMNWSGMGMPGTPQRSVFRRMRCASGAIGWKNPATKWTGDRCFIRVPGAQLSSAVNCARRKYRLTPQAVDGRSNCRRFSDEQKRAMVQETEKPGVSVAEVCRRHGIATSLLFRWRVQFGHTTSRAG
jgi:hypothetical protein